MRTAAKVPNAGPLFTGEDVWRQPLGEAGDVGYFVVGFGKGVRNKLHTHTQDQILVVTEGRGVVATETVRREVTVGDVAFIPKGERHWHGAVEGSTFAHIAISVKPNRTDQIEP